MSKKSKIIFLCHLDGIRQLFGVAQGLVFYGLAYSMHHCLYRCLFFFLQMNMLMKLQEAANYSSTQSCDSESTSHHEDILDSSLESTL